MQDVRRVAEQQREEANRKIARAVAQQEAAKEKVNARQSAFAGYSLPLTERYTDDAGMLDMSFKIEQADGDRGTFLGLFEVSYLMTDANAVTIPVAVKDDNIVKKSGNRQSSRRDSSTTVRLPYSRRAGTGIYEANLD